MPRGPSLAVVAVLAVPACRFDSDGSEAGGAWEPADGSESSAGESGESSASSTTADDTTSGDAPTTVADDDGSSTSADEGDAPDPCPRVRVVVMPGGTLNVRPSASTAGESVGELPNNAIVDHVADVHGEWIETTDLWFEVGSDEFQVSGFVSADYAECTMEQAPELHEPDGFYLPLECNASAEISQGNNGSYSHQGNAYYAFDFLLHRYADTVPGDPCYAGGDDTCYPYANLVVLLHGDGLRSIYKHLSEVWVADGEFVPRGGVVGLSGSSGYSTGPHAHVMRQENCPEANCPSIPLEFVDIGVPEQGDTVMSSNCP